MAKAPSFITELRLKVNCEQERKLLVRLEAARHAAFGAVRQRFQFSEYALHDDAEQFGHSWLGDHLDSHAVQKVAALRVGVGRADRPRFKGKSNKTGIMWREGQVQWRELVLQPIYPRKPDPLIEYGLGSRVKYV